jgi:3-oxoadipate enol-lactonase
MTVPLHHTVDRTVDGTVDGTVDAPLLILGASLGTTGAMWQPQVPALAQRFRVVRYDHRGHGGSPVPPGPYSIEDLGGDVLALADTLGAGRFHLAGASLGSMVALWVAAHAPDRVDRLVLVGTSARPGTPQSWRDRAATVRARGTAAIAEPVVGRWLPAEFAQAHPQLRAALLDAVTTTSDEGYAGCCAALENLDLAPDLARVTAPTLVIVGSDDESTPPEGGRAVAAGIPGARVAEVAGAAHLANLSHADEVTRLLLDFLD